MKNKLIKAILVLFLCIVMLTGCSVVPSSTLDITPTPIEPTPTPIPYGEVIDVIIDTNDKKSFNWNIAQILLEKFSIKLIEYTPSTIGAPDIVLHTNSGMEQYITETELRYEAGKDAMDIGGINYLEYLNNMPNYSSLLYSKEVFYNLFKDTTDRYSLPRTGKEPIRYKLWLYNEKWFEKYNYSIPETMDDLVDLLIDHKTNVDPASQPILINTRNGKDSTIMDTSLSEGVFATYGIDYDEMIKKGSEGVYGYTMSDPKVIEALDVLKKINDSSLAGDLYLNYDDISTSDLSECAVFYDSYSIYKSTYIRDIKSEGLNWKIFETQLSYDGTPYVTCMDYFDGGAPLLHDFIILESAGNEVINRFIDYIDWCSTEEGVLASVFGTEGIDYKIGEDGKLTLLKEYIEIEPAAINVVSDEHILKILYKYGYTGYPYFLESYITNIAKEFVENTDISIISQHELSYPYTVARDEYKLVSNVSKQFFNDYINGTKFASDFNEYLTALDDAGLNELLQKTNDYYKDIYEKLKDYVSMITTS